MATAQVAQEVTFEFMCTVQAATKPQTTTDISAENDKKQNQTK